MYRKEREGKKEKEVKKEAKEEVKQKNIKEGERRGGRGIGGERCMNFGTIAMGTKCKKMHKQKRISIEHIDYQFIAFVDKK